MEQVLWLGEGYLKPASDLQDSILINNIVDIESMDSAG
jgi:hypothetical protein